MIPTTESQVTDMDFLEFSRRRYSVRSYSQREVEDEKINKILQAALIAPTAVNYQPEKIYVLKSQNALRTIRSITKSTYNAPLVFLICSDTERSWHSPFVENYNSGEMDASIVCTHMMLEAEDLGLGSVWVKMYDPAKVIRAFGLTENVVPHCLLPVGYPAVDSEPYRPWHDVFRRMDDIAEVI